MKQIETSTQIGNVIRHRLDGRTVTSLAEKTGIPRATLYKKLDGRSPFTLGELVRVASALGMTPGDLVSAATDPEALSA